MASDSQRPGSSDGPRPGFTARPLLLPDDAGDTPEPSGRRSQGDGVANAPAGSASDNAPIGDTPAPTDLDRAWGVTTATDSDAGAEAGDETPEAPAPAADAPPNGLPGAVAEPAAVADVAMLPSDAVAGAADAPAPAPADDFVTHLPGDGAEGEGDASADAPQTRLDAAVDAVKEAGATAVAAVAAAVTPVVSAAADALAPAAESADDADDTPPAGTDAESDDAPEPTDEASADAAEAQAEADIADEVNDAFDTETAPGKRDRPAPVAAVEGTLGVPELGPDAFEPDDLKAVLRLMLTSRRLDEKMLTLLKQGKGFFHIGSSGHEAAQIALGREMRAGHDAFCFYYRDLGTALSLGMTPEEILQAHFAKADDPFGGGRQMPEHFGHKGLNIMSTSSSVGAQFVPAVGFALAHRRDGAEGGQDGVADGEGKLVYTSGGEGSTSQGAFHEALNWAARESLPVLFHVQDNGYAISVPVAEQTAGASIWPLFAGYTGLERLRYDGTDFFQAASAARVAVAHARQGRGPVALHADVVRLLPHSSSDDHGKYREGEVLASERDRDPIPRFTARLVEAGVVTADEVEAMRAEIHREIDELARAVEAQPDPDPAQATTHVYYEGEDTRQYEADGPAGELIVMVDAINHALDEEMARDERVLVFGEDVGGGKGGVFTATRGLTAKHGRDRCFNSPLAEASIVGAAVGLACAGYKPVVEIQFADYVWPGMDAIRNQVASMRYRSNGAWATPMVIRMPCGGYIHGGLCHSQNVEAMFAHFPGLQVVMPSNAADAKGLLKSAIRGEDPVIFLEHKSLYRQGPARRPEPHADWLLPLGKASVAREGTDLTIVTWGAIVYRSLNAARALEKEGVSVEVVDVRSMLPLDTETILASARKTGRVLVAYEDHEFMGFGAEIAAQVSKLAFHDLDAPVHRVAGAFSSIPYADPLEAVVLPQDESVLAAAREVLAF